MDDAILELEPLVAAREGGLLRIKCAIALSRCYRESGDLVKATEVGERVLAQLAGPRSTAPTRPSRWRSPWRLPTTSAATRARPSAPVARRSPRPRAVLAGRPSVGVLERQHLRVTAGLRQQRSPPGRARAGVAGRGPGGRNLARLRNHSAACSSRLDPPDIAEAQANLDKAAEEMAWCSATVWTSPTTSWLGLGRSSCRGGLPTPPTCVPALVDRRPRRTAAGGRCARLCRARSPVAG